MREQKESYVIDLFDYEVDEAGHRIYMVMELASLDLSQLFKRSQSEAKKASLKVNPSAANTKFVGYGLNEVQLRFYWQEMLRCVRACHNHRIIHLDLKPSNFVIVDGRVKIIDFGIARVVNTAETSVIRESQVGTVNYMAPETILSNTTSTDGAHAFQLRTASDVWSMGCILYQMVYGVTPFSHFSNLPQVRHGFMSQFFSLVSIHRALYRCVLITNSFLLISISLFSV